MLMFSPNRRVPIRLLRNERSSRIDWPPKSQNMKPTMSSTAAGSRITVCFPAGSSCGAADSMALRAAISASSSGSRFRTSGELAFHRVGSRENAGGGEFALLGDMNNFADALGALLGRNGGGLFKVATRNWPALSAIRGHRQQVRVGVLNFGEIFGGSDGSLQ